MTDAEPTTPWAFGSLTLEEDRFEDVAIGVSTRRGVAGAEEIAVVDVELEAREPGADVAFTVTVGATARGVLMRRCSG